MEAFGRGRAVEGLMRPLGRDKAIPPACERWMYRRANARKITEVPTSSHVAMISHPKITADFIEDAAKATC